MILESHEMEEKRLQEVINMLNYLDKNKKIKFKIRYILDVIEVFGDELYKKENSELCNTIIGTLSRIEKALDLNKLYIEMTSREAKIILIKTISLGFDKNNVVVTRGINNYKKNRIK